MLVNNANITEKKYKKLVLQVSQTAMSFCCIDTLNDTILLFKEIVFELSDKSNNIEECYSRTYNDHEELKDAYDEVLVLHDNNLATFVPTALFDENHLGNYLQYNTKVFVTDFFAFDDIPTFQINTVYIPYMNINNFFIEKYGAFNYKHCHSILVSKLLTISKNIDEKKMFVHLKEEHFEIIVVQNQKLLLFNSFEYKTPDDLIYYLLFTAEQLNLNPESMILEFIGNINKDDQYYNIAYKYIRNISIFDIESITTKNNFSISDNLKHFILFQS